MVNDYSKSYFCEYRCEKHPKGCKKVDEGHTEWAYSALPWRLVTTTHQENYFEGGHITV